MTDRAITKAQIRSIKAAQRGAGLDDATYRAMLHERYGVRSSTELSRRQATELLTSFGRPLTRAGRRPRKPRPDRLPAGATRLATPVQRALIAELAGEVGWRAADGYAAWLQRNMGIERVATSAQAARVIQGLLAMRRRG